MSWQLIETAPLAKTVLLYAVTDADDSGRVRNWKMGSGWQGRDGAWFWENRRVASYEVKPTHWQPLPEPPGEQAEHIGEQGRMA